MPQLAVAVARELSVTMPLKGNAPAWVGLPVTPPEALSVRPGGNDPVEIPKETKVPVPPLAEKVDA
jgi:hypothetical protein